MKYRHQSLAVVLSLTLTAAGSAWAGAPDAQKQEPTMEELQQDILQLTEKLKGYGLEKQQEAISRLEESLKEIDERISDLQSELDANWDQMSEQARQEAQKGLETLRERREMLSRWYNRLQGNSADAWSDIRKDVEDAYQIFQKAWQERKDRNEPEPSDDERLREQSI